MPIAILNFTSFAASPMLAFGLPSGGEWIILLILGLLIFGRRLPDVGRSLGRGIVEFKKGIRGIEEEIDSESSKAQLGPSARQELPTAAQSPSKVDDRNPYAGIAAESRKD